MPKTAYILAVMLFAVLSYSQEITFHENINHRASVLKQSLDETGNYLVLESVQEPISQIDIFSDDFSESIHVKKQKTKISLEALPVGDFVIQARVDKKWIVMYLEKNKAFEIASSTPKEIESKEAQTIQQTASKITQNNNSVYFWVVYESNSNFGSSSSMSLEYKDKISKLILKHNLELKSSIGKGNKLIIYEVRNKSEFMDKQFRDPTYYKSEEASKFLSSKPLYVSHSAEDDDY